MRVHLLILVCLTLASTIKAEEHFARTKELVFEGDLAKEMVGGIGKWLNREILAAEKSRRNSFEEFLKANSSIAIAQKQTDPLKSCLGVPDCNTTTWNFVTSKSFLDSKPYFENDFYTVHEVKWQVFDSLEAEGLIVEPKKPAIMNYLVIPDAECSPEQLLGLDKSALFPVADYLAKAGCRVVIPETLDRKQGFGQSLTLGRKTNIPRREFVYRMAYEMGHQINGLEISKQIAALQILKKLNPGLSTAVYGIGEGGFQALCLNALRDDLKSCVVDGYFYNKVNYHNEPIDRNIWRLWKHFSDAELVVLGNAPTIIHLGNYPVYEGARVIDNLGQAAPGILVKPDQKMILKEVEQLNKYLGLKKTKVARMIEEAKQEEYSKVLQKSLEDSSVKANLNAFGKSQNTVLSVNHHEERQIRQFQNMVEFVQRSWRQSESVRNKFLNLPANSPRDTVSNRLNELRNVFWEDVIGKLPPPNLAKNPKSRLIYDTPEFKGYEITLDLYEDVFAQGIILIPKNIKEGEKRPVVVCQHGLEGKPVDVCVPDKKTPYYNSFGAELARKGYIVFAPQNPYIGKTEFRQLQRMANPIGLSLFSFIIRQHEAILQWLKSNPEVDGTKIAFYGLSYGGKTAMRVPSILPDYCLSICSGDFNEWIGKNVSIDYIGSYMWTFEYEMYEFNLGKTFNYAEMAYLIHPRPFMVERGHSDGVGNDEMVSWEFSKVRRFYAMQDIPENTTIEYFKGGHEIHGKGTYEFLQKHLGWPRK